MQLATHCVLHRRKPIIGGISIAFHRQGKIQGKCVLCVMFLCGQSSGSTAASSWKQRCSLFAVKDCKVKPASLSEGGEKKTCWFVRVGLMGCLNKKLKWQWLSFLLIESHSYVFMCFYWLCIAEWFYKQVSACWLVLESYKVL